LFIFIDHYHREYNDVYIAYLNFGMDFVFICWHDLNQAVGFCIDLLFLNINRQ